MRRWWGRLGAALGVVALALALVAVLPSAAWAWSPATHVFLGEAVLRSLDLLPRATAELLRACPYDFLYGSIAADTSVAKKYAPAGRHCHAWHVGREIHDRAPTRRLRAFGLGYLAHLAADTVAHNFFVPRYLVATSRTSGLGHSYWESRFEGHLGSEFPRRARELLTGDHAPADAHLDRILSPTLFSTATGRRIFRGMVTVSDWDSWQRIMQLAAENSRWDIPELEVARYMERSYNYVIDLLRRDEESEPHGLDPAGDDALRLAVEVRREARLSGMDYRRAAAAVRRFGLPPSDLDYAATRDPQLYVPARSRSS